MPSRIVLLAAVLACCVASGHAASGGPITSRALRGVSSASLTAGGTDPRNLISKCTEEFRMSYIDHFNWVRPAATCPVRMQCPVGEPPGTGNRGSTKHRLLASGGVGWVSRCQSQTRNEPAFQNSATSTMSNLCCDSWAGQQWTVPAPVLHLQGQLQKGWTHLLLFRQ